ncbi:MAG TPA: TonB-dependent receptor, partial [Flavobacterium sp.]|nr:TonB-dependent receptor [Flavobacterium sp.]
QQLHDEISSQTQLQVLRISDRYYSLGTKTEPVHDTEYLDEIVVFTFLSKGITKDGQKMIISPQKVEELPGVTDADILLSLQQLPGVKSPNETASGLHVRGGTLDQNLIMWDGIRMYHPGHLFGMISGFNPNVKQKVHYYNKAADPKFGERISSVIDIRTSNEISDSLSVDAGINALDADVYVRAPLVKNKLGVQLAARKSITEQVQSPTFNALADKVFQNTDFTNFRDDNKFGFYDLSAKLNYNSGHKNDFSLTGIAIDNHLDFTTVDNDSQRKVQNMNIRNYGSSFSWNHRYNSNFRHHFLLHYSLYSFDYQRTQHQPNYYDSFIKLNRVIDSGAELNFSYETSETSHVDFGYQLFGNDISHSFTNAIPNLSFELDQKHLFNVTHAGFLNIRYDFEQWKLQGGVRFNYFAHLDRSSLEPRVSIERYIAKNLNWQMSYERKSQIASQARESVTNDLSLENYVWVLADGGDYPVQKGQQYTMGFVYKTKPFVVDIDLYYKTLEGVTSMTFGFVNEFDSTVNTGNGFTKGIDFLIQKNAPDWSVWLTYTYQDSQNRYDGINGGRYFPISSETRHAVSLSYFKKWGNYSLSAGWFLHSGRPYSELNSTSDSTLINDKRLPAHHRLNISAAYRFNISSHLNGRVGFSVFNAYNKRTVISQEYERRYVNLGDFANPNNSLRNYYSLGITPNIFCRISF